jgi:hypothetical protein
MTRIPIALLVMALGAVACGSGADSSETSAAAPPAATADDGLVSQQTIDGCAGFTSEKAAVLLGLDPAIVTDYSRTEGRLRNCVYRQSDRNTGIVSFTLSRRDSVDAAKRSMAGERESMGMADRAISGVTGSESKEPAAQDVSRIGDEAFYSPLNGAIMLRVGNAIAQVTGPNEMGLKKRAAEQVAEGLRR